MVVALEGWAEQMHLEETTTAVGKSKNARFYEAVQHQLEVASR